MQEMRFVLEHFADLCDIMPSDAVQEGDAGRNDPAATWTYMAGRLQKMGGGRTGRNRSYKERTFELGKNELRYKAGATKGNSWQSIDLSSGTVMVGKGYKPGPYKPGNNLEGLHGANGKLSCAAGGYF